MNNKTNNTAEQPIEEGLTLSQTTDQGVDRLNQSALPAIDINQPLPDLGDAKAIPLDLMSDYWTPETVGESKRVFFVKLASSMVKAVDSDTLVELECAYFLEKVSGEVRQIRNGSKRLVGTLVDAVDQGFVRQGTPMEITYKGKKRNRTGPFSSDIWSIKPLLINVDTAA